MDELSLTKPKRIVLVASLLLVIVLFLTALEAISAWQQDRIGWLIASIRPFVVSIFTIVVLYLLNGRSQGLAEKLHRMRLSLLFPALEEFVEDQRRRHANRLVAEKMDVTLNFYRLTVLNPPENPKPEVIGKWRARWRRLWLRWRRPPEKAQISCRMLVAEIMPLLVLIEEDRIQNCASLLEQCGVFTESGKAVTADLLCLLYREQHGLETLLFFEEIWRDEAKRKPLAQTLLDSKQLPERRPQINPPQLFDEKAVIAELDKLKKEQSKFSFASMVEKLKRRQQQVAAYQIVVDKMYHTLDYFGLEASEEAKDALIDAALEDDDPNMVLAHCALAVGPLVIHWPLVLELLYRWLYGMDTAVLYKQLDPAQDLPDLAVVLLNGRWLPTRWQSQPFSQEEIITSLEEIADFDLKELQNKLLTRHRQIRAYQAVVDRMKEILTVFHLGSLDQKAYTGLMDKAPDSDDLETLVSHCTTAIAKVVAQPKELLNLLYRDEQRLAQPSSWQKHIPVLVGVLAQNPRLPQKELGENRTEPFSQEEICQALKQLPHFSLEGLIKQLLANETKRLEGVAILRRMEYTLNYYRLFNRLQEGTAHLTGENGTWAFSHDFQQDYCARLPDQFSPEEYTSRCAATVASRLAPNTELPSANKLVELVYRERNGLQTADFWFKRRKELAPGMAELLVNSGKLPDPTVSMPYQPASLQEMLQEHEDFSLNFIRDEVDHISVLWRLAVKYHEFLKRHEIQGWKMDVFQLMQLLKPLPSTQPELPQLKTRDLDILLWAGEESIKASVPAAQEHLRSYCQVALAIFLTDETDPRSRQLLAQVCRDMGTSPDNTAVRISLAYVDLMADLEARQEAEVRDFVTVRSLIENWAKRDEDLHTLKGYKKEILSLAQTFRRGEWLNHLWETLTQTLNDLKTANAPVKALVDNRQHLVEALRRIFMRLDVRTIERFLEARTTTAYLIAFDSTKGSLASLLDSFMLRPDTFAAEKESKRQRLWDAFQQLQELGVHLQTEDGRWLYNFCQYTFNTRIGVLPPGWNMREFAKVFGQDMATVTEASKKAKEILAPDYEWDKEFEATEVILHRFGLRNHYALELKSRSENAVNNMKRLFATHIDFDNLLATIGYENLELVDMAAAIMQGTILELAHDQQMNSLEQTKLARHDMALKLVLLWRSGRLELQIDDLAILGKTLNKEQVKRIAQKLQEDAVLRNTLERILSRHTGIASKDDRLQLGEALLTHLTEMVTKNCRLTGLRQEAEAWLQDPVLQADAWAAELVTLAVLQAAECLVMNKEEQDLIDEGIKDLAYQLAGDQDGNALQTGADWLSEAMIDLIPKPVAARCPTIATAYLATLRDVAGLADGNA